MTNCPQSRLYRSHTQNYSFLRSNRANSLLWARVEVHVEQLVHILWLQLCFFLLFNHAFDSFQATEEDHCVLEPLEVVELFEVDSLPLVRCSETAVVASLLWTLIEDSLQTIGHTHVIAPVDALLEEGLGLADHLAGVEFDVLIEI